MSDRQTTSIVELDMSEWPVELLYYLIIQSADRDISVNKIICEILENYLNKMEHEL